MDDTRLVVVVDDDDPERDGYATLPVYSFLTVQYQSAHHRLNPIMNAAAVEVADIVEIIGFMGDDHLPRTEGWDSWIGGALDNGPGVAYGNDLLQGEALATAVFISAPIIECLGFFSPPPLQHLFMDNYWMHLGRATHLTYLPHVIIEHLHPLVGKAQHDDGYARANSPETWAADSAAWNTYLANSWAGDLQKLRDAGLAP